MISSTPTIFDVARQASVGIATVSRVLNGSRSVSPQTRARVLASIEQLGYRPSESAQSLARGSRDALGVVVPDVTHPSAVERLRGVLAVMGDNPMQVVAFDVASPEQRDRQLRHLRMLDQAAGLIIISLSPTDEDATALKRAGLAVVLLDCEHPDLSRVVVDDVRGGELATQHLVSLGHQRIAFVGDDWPTGYGFRAAARRYQGYSQTLIRAGLAVREDYYRRGPYGRESALRLTNELLALPEPPTAIFAASDTQALGVLQAINEGGLVVPEDISVVGFDDLDIASYVGLTTVRQPLVHSGQRATELLLDMLHGHQHATVEERLPLELVVRTSTGPPPPDPG